MYIYFVMAKSLYNTSYLNVKYVLHVFLRCEGPLWLSMSINQSVWNLFSATFVISLIKVWWMGSGISAYLLTPSDETICLNDKCLFFNYWPFWNCPRRKSWVHKSLTLSLLTLDNCLSHLFEQIIHIHVFLPTLRKKRMCDCELAFWYIYIYLFHSLSSYLTAQS